MTKTKTFRARLADGSETEVQARWCPDAQWYVAYHGLERLYFQEDGAQI